MKTAWNTLWTIVLLPMALVGLPMSLCGGLFTVTNRDGRNANFRFSTCRFPAS